MVERGSKINVDWNVILEEANQDESFDPELSILNKLSPEIILEILSRLRWNEALPTASVCSVFNDLLQSASLWTTLKELNFVDCHMPLAKHILKVVTQCPNIEKLKLSEVIIEKEDKGEEVATTNSEDSATDDREDELIVQDVEFEDNEPDAIDEMDEEDSDDGRPEEEKPALSGYDNFLAEMLKACEQLKHLTLDSHEIAGGTVEVISRGVSQIESLELSSAKNFHSKYIEKLLSEVEHLKRLHVAHCELHYPLVRQKSGKQVALTSLGLVGCRVGGSEIALIGENCPRLRHLDLSESSGFRTFGLPGVAASNFQCLETVCLNDCEYLREVILEDLVELQSVDLTQSAHLTYAKLKCSNLSYLELTGCTDLAKLVVHSDQMEAMNLAYHFPVLSGLDVKCAKLNKLLLCNCPELRRDQITGMENLAVVKDVTLRNVQFTLDDINQDILPKLLALEDLYLEGFGSSSLEVSSRTIKKLNCQDLAKLCQLSLDTPELTTLNMTNVRVLEGDFAGNLPRNLSELHLCQMPGLDGCLLSQQGHALVNLTNLLIRDCRFMKQLTLVDWPSLKSVDISGCPQLKQICVKGATIMDLKILWLHLNDFSVDAPLLDQLDIKGSNFQKFRLISESLEHLEVAGLCVASKVSEDDVHICCPSLKHLWIQKSPFMTSAMMKSILSGCPSVSELHLTNCKDLQEVSLPRSVHSLKLVAMPRLAEILLDPDCTLNTITLSGLPKLNLDTRKRILQEVTSQIEDLEIRLVNEDKMFHLMYPNVTSLSLDQGLQLHTVDIDCPKLKSLRIKGCPKLTKLLLNVDSVSELDISQSMPLHALESLQIASESAKNLAKILSHYCPGLQHLSLRVKSLSMADLVRFGLQHRNLKSILVHSETEIDGTMKATFPSTFQIPCDVLERPNGEDLVVSFS